MKYRSHMRVRITSALVIGFVLAAVGTKITFTCTPIDGAKGCVSFEKAVMHPTDLLNNKQDSLVQFSVTFATAAMASFALISVIGLAQKKRV